MKKVNRFLTGILFLGTTIANAQLKTPAPSPIQTVKQDFALSAITIEYSRPSAKGRVIYGDLVPFDAIWRTGANASTKITFGEDVKIEENTVPAGTYSLYAIPGKAEWTIIINKNITLWGSDGYKIEEDAVRIKVKSTMMTSKVETFTIDIANMTANTASIELVWENTRVAFKVEAEIDSKIMKNIETAMAPDDKRPYYSAAKYYYDNNKDLNQALTWVNKATEQNAKAYWVFLLKANIQVKLKDTKGAVATAQQVVTLAKEDKNDDYVKMGQKIIDDNKK